MAPVHHRYADVQGQRIFYREAGDADAPAVVLLHGFPTSSFMFRDLIPPLAERFHVIAPDHLGFGLRRSSRRTATATTRGSSRASGSRSGATRASRHPRTRRTRAAR